MKKSINAKSATVNVKSAATVNLLACFNADCMIHTDRDNMTDETVTAYDSDITAQDFDSTLSVKAFVLRQLHIDNAQIKRDLSADTDKTSKFCRLLESTKQNYRIDKALESFHTMRELMSITDCSEARIKSHCQYIEKNCRYRVKKEVADKKFRYVIVAEA